MRFPHIFGRFSMKSLEQKNIRSPKFSRKTQCLIDTLRLTPEKMVAAPHEKEIDGLENVYPFKNGDLGYQSGQIITFHQPGFS